MTNFTEIISMVGDKITHPSAFFAMGGYGAYVWSSFGASSIALVILLLALQRRLRRALAQQTAQKNTQQSD